MIRNKKKNLLMSALLLTVAALHASSKEGLSSSELLNTASYYNHYVLTTIDMMPVGGGYSVETRAMNHFQEAITLKEEQLYLDPKKSEPSFCSGATYLVFLKTFLLLEEQKKILLPPPTLEALLPHHFPDGKGFWGRWNANGPGVARLFYSLKLGPNFTSLAAAQPGDFLKIFWTDEIGAKEHGHLVIFLGSEKKGNITTITYWSSNKSSNGYGKKTVPLSQTHHLIFSRLTNPQNILNLSSLPTTDLYLASLLTRSSSWEEVKACCHF